MAESVDDTPKGQSGIDEDSDVIELTDEVNSMAPSADPEVAEDTPSNAENTPDQSPNHSGESTRSVSVPSDPSSQDSDDDDGGYDRQSMVKTMQMDAIDREAFEEEAESDDDGDIPVVDDARFAPEIIVSPPRVLVKKWQEGLPASVASIVAEPAGDMASEQAADVEPQVPDPPEDQEAGDGDLAPTPDESSPDSDQPPSDDEPIELDEELVELDDDDLEPDEAASPAPSEPPPHKKPKRKRQATPPPASPAQSDASSAAPETDPEMSGLVKELIEDEKQQREQENLGPRQTWFKNVFSEEYLRSVPENIAEITEKDVDFIEKSLRLKKKSRILDLACGFGRHSIELSHRGYEMVGLDLSRPLLQHALDAAQQRSLNVKFIHGDMRDLSFSGIFDGAFVWDTSLGYFDDRTNLGVLQGLYRALKVGGRLLVDVINRDHVIQQTPTRLWWEGNGCIFLEETEFDYQTSTLESQRSYIYEDGTPPVEHTSFIRLYNVHELRQMLHVAGFKVLEVSGARHHKGHFLGEASRRIIILAEKRKKKQSPKNDGSANAEM